MPVSEDLSVCQGGSRRHCSYASSCSLVGKETCFSQVVVYNLHRPCSFFMTTVAIQPMPVVSWLLIHPINFSLLLTSCCHSLCCVFDTHQVLSVFVSVAFCFSPLAPGFVTLFLMIPQVEAFGAKGEHCFVLRVVLCRKIIKLKPV